LRRSHRHVDCHPEVIAGCADKTTGNRNRLADVAGDCNAYQIAAVDGSVCRILRDPTVRLVYAYSPGIDLSSNGISYEFPGAMNDTAKGIGRAFGASIHNHNVGAPKS
jgi:hypothetical protein